MNSGSKCYQPELRAARFGDSLEATRHTVPVPPRRDRIDSDLDHRMPRRPIHGMRS